MEQVANALEERLLRLIHEPDISATKIATLVNSYIKLKRELEDNRSNETKR